jgi:hypothetical protein
LMPLQRLTTANIFEQEFVDLSVTIVMCPILLDLTIHAIKVHPRMAFREKDFDRQEFSIITVTERSDGFLLSINGRQK